MILAAREPFAARAALAFLEHRAVPGVEDVAPYRRSLRLTHGAGVATLRPAAGAESDTPRAGGADGETTHAADADSRHAADGETTRAAGGETTRAAGGAIDVELDLDDPRDEPEAVACVRELLDLDAPAPEIAAVLGRDPLLRFTPGLRVPGGDAGEIAVRAVLTQQISVRAASTHAARLVAAAGEPLARPRGTITHLFPTLEAIAEAPDAAFALPAKRRATLRALAGVPPDQLIDLPGVGPWTQAYVALRALRDRDAWLPTDLGVRHALRRLGHDGDAERWRPYRGYAVIQLWQTGA